MKVIGIYNMPIRTLTRKVGSEFVLESGRYLIIVDKPVNGIVVSKSREIVPVGIYKNDTEKEYGVWIDVVTNNVVRFSEFENILEVITYADKPRNSNSKRNRRASRSEIQE